MGDGEKATIVRVFWRENTTATRIRTTCGMTTKRLQRPLMQGSYFSIFPLKSRGKS